MARHPVRVEAVALATNGSLLFEFDMDLPQKPRYRMSLRLRGCRPGTRTLDGQLLHPCWSPSTGSWSVRWQIGSVYMDDEWHLPKTPFDLDDLDSAIQTIQLPSGVVGARPKLWKLHMKVLDPVPLTDALYRDVASTVHVLGRVDNLYGSNSIIEVGFAESRLLDAIRRVNFLMERHGVNTELLKDRT